MQIAISVADISLDQFQIPVGTGLESMGEGRGMSVNMVRFQDFNPVIVYRNTLCRLKSVTQLCVPTICTATCTSKRDEIRAKAHFMSVTISPASLSNQINKD